MQRFSLIVMMPALLGLGSNIEPRRDFLGAAIEVLSSHACHHVRVSSYYETDPVGYTHQNLFLNACIAFGYNLSPQDLFGICKDLETRIGRRHRERWREREIDIDILLFGDMVVCDSNLVIPHPRFHERAFALVPACEIAADMVHPGFGVTVSSLLDRVDDSHQVRLLDVGGQVSQ